MRRQEILYTREARRASQKQLSIHPRQSPSRMTYPLIPHHPHQKRLVFDNPQNLP